MIHLFLFVAFVADLGYSFLQHYQMSIGGDIAQIVLPSSESGYYHVLQDPLGLSALVQGETYSNPNRFFAHWPASLYFLNVPLILQGVVAPITSIYLSIALLKTLVQALIIYLLALYITGKRNPFSFDFLLVVVLLSPLFQTSGYNRFMGIIDQSVIYTFFYALPMAFLLIFLLPFIRSLGKRRKIDFSLWQMSLMMGFGFVLAMGGPLNPGIILIICLMCFLFGAKIFVESRSISSVFEEFTKQGLTARMLVVLSWVGFLSLYSLYIGTYNDLNSLNPTPLWERYLRIPAGLWTLIGTKLGLPLLLLMIGINTIFIRTGNQNSEGKSVLKVLHWIGAFTLLYLLLLPLGGYRIYRPNIVRYDTFIPITVMLIFFYGMSTFYLIRHVSGRHKLKYVLIILVFMALFTNADRLSTRNYACEKEALEYIRDSEEDIVMLKSDCPIMEFRLVTDYPHSNLKAQLLQHWNVTDHKKLFYQGGDRGE